MDAFAVSISSGICNKRLEPIHALKGAFFFGFFQFAMPLAGWYMGIRFINVIKDFDHWIAFGLLSLIGIKMILEASKGNKAECLDSDAAPEIRTDIRNLKTLLVLSVATSIDALAIGLTFSVIGETIWSPALLIGAVTFIICLAGFEFGKRIGHLVKQRAEIFGGFVLISIGTKILLEHLYF